MTRRPVLSGLVLVTLGVLLLLDELGALNAGELLATWWPLAVIGAGVVQATVRPRAVGGGLVVVAVGTVLQLWRLHVVDDLSLLWPVLLLTLGGWLLVGRRSRHRSPEIIDSAGDGEELDVVAVFSDRHVRVAPGHLLGGSVVTVFGDADLDLTATVPSRRAKLDGVTILGDLDLVVPASWRVTTSGPTLFGDVRVDDPVQVGGEPAPELRLELVTIFGDVRVRRTATSATATV